MAAVGGHPLDLDARLRMGEVHACGERQQGRAQLHLDGAGIDADRAAIAHAPRADCEASPPHPLAKQRLADAQHAGEVRRRVALHVITNN